MRELSNEAGLDRQLSERRMQILTIADCAGLAVLAYPMFAFGVFGLAFARPAGVWCMALVAWTVIELLRLLIGFRRLGQRLPAVVRRTICGVLCAVTLVYVIDFGDNGYDYASWHWDLIGLVPLFVSLASEAQAFKRQGGTT